jgi:hypothetical protein
MVVEIVEFCVWTISDWDDTVTVSSRPPTSSVARTFAPAPEVSTTLLMTEVLNPCNETVTVYRPMLRAGNEKAPSEFVTAETVVPVALCLAVTSAPGMTAPLPSTTIPASVDVVPPWP